MYDYILGAKVQADNIAFNLADNPLVTLDMENEAVDKAIKVAKDQGYTKIADKIGIVYKNGDTKIIEINKFSIENGIKF